MFRRPGKNPLDNEENESPLFAEGNSLPYKYGPKKSDLGHHSEMTGRMFEPVHSNAMTMQLPSHLEERRSEGYAQEKTTPLPRHFRSSLEEEPETTLGEGVTFRGELSFERLLRIDGTFEGDLLSQGKVIVGPHGVVKANLNLREAIIEGQVEGNIVVAERLELRGEAVVIGDIEAKFLSVDEGVRIQGLVQVSGSPKPNESQK
jgi:cytoskeletal protein CcmA (bactofilin family)